MTNSTNKSDKFANPMWGGHYAHGPSKLMETINASINFDKKFYAQDIMGSKAHAAMLVKCNILTEEEGKKISAALDQIKKEIEKGKFRFTPHLEDIHMHIEARLHDIIGDVAGKLHTARSRNDQVATDFKLYVRDAIDHLDILLKELQAALIKNAEENYDAIMPGYTHMQTAQPITLGHHLLAYVEMIGRDRSRLSDARERLNFCPLGSAALAGTSFPIDREQTADALGFSGPTTNSVDAVSDRDFAMEFLSVASICAVHLSRLSEEIVIWASADFNFIKLSESFTTGSSIMPQKRNPDAAELIRAKAGRIFGGLMSLLTVMKGLPLTYSKDMQEDKEPIFDVVDNLTLCILAMTGMLNETSYNNEKMLEAADRGFSTATDIADWLVQNLSIPFRKAHHVTGRIVKKAEANNCKLHELSLADMQEVEAGITDDIYNVLSVENSVASRKSFGGTAPQNVKKAIEEAKKRFL